MKYVRTLPSGQTITTVETEIFVVDFFYFCNEIFYLCNGIFANIFLLFRKVACGSCEKSDNIDLSVNMAPTTPSCMYILVSEIPRRAVLRLGQGGGGQHNRTINGGVFLLNGDRSFGLRIRSDNAPYVPSASAKKSDNGF